VEAEQVVMMKHSEPWHSMCSIHIVVVCRVGIINHIHAAMHAAVMSEKGDIKLEKKKTATSKLRSARVGHKSNRIITFPDRLVGLEPRETHSYVIALL
jgi:hypothetical protein